MSRHSAGTGYTPTHAGTTPPTGCAFSFLHARRVAHVLAAGQTRHQACQSSTAQGCILPVGGCRCKVQYNATGHRRPPPCTAPSCPWPLPKATAYHAPPPAGRCHELPKATASARACHAHGRGGGPVMPMAAAVHAHAHDSTSARPHGLEHMSAAAPSIPRTAATRRPWPPPGAAHLSETRPVMPSLHSASAPSILSPSPIYILRLLPPSAAPGPKASDSQGHMGITTVQYACTPSTCPASPRTDHCTSQHGLPS